MNSGRRAIILAIALAGAAAQSPEVKDGSGLENGIRRVTVHVRISNELDRYVSEEQGQTKVLAFMRDKGLEVTAAADNVLTAPAGLFDLSVLRIGQTVLIVGEYKRTVFVTSSPGNQWYKAVGTTFLRVNSTEIGLLSPSATTQAKIERAYLEVVRDFTEGYLRANPR